MEQENLDLHLVAALRRGEDQAFRNIYNAYFPRLSNLACLLIGTAEAEDVVADGFLKLFIHKEEMESIAHVEGFLHTTIKNACLDLLRKSARRNRLLGSLINWNGHAEIAGSESQADHKILFGELIYCIQAAIDSMPERSRQSFRLVIHEGLSAIEAGKLLDVSDQTVREDIKRVRQQINAHLLKKGLSFFVVGWLLGKLLLFF